MSFLCNTHWVRGVGNLKSFWTFLRYSVLFRCYFDVSGLSLLGGMSAWPVKSCIIESILSSSDIISVSNIDAECRSTSPCHQYWVDVQLIWCFRSFNIGWYVSLTFAVRHWILSQCSANPMFSVFQYWMVCQPDLWKTCIEYWVDVQLIWCFRSFNIGWYISLTCAVRHWILSRYLANPIFSVFQYWMVCQPDLWSHTLNIESMFS